MSHYVFEYTKKPISFKSDPVLLVQYMVFRNRLNSEKYMMIKLGNQTSRDVLEVKLEFLQFDSFNKKLSKTQYVFADLHMGGHEKTVPYEIIRVSGKCNSVECQVLHVKAENGIWQDGTWQSTEADHDDEDNRLNRASMLDDPSMEGVAGDHKEVKFPVFMTVDFIVLYFFLIFIILIPSILIR